jgi:hypothetical protein
LLRQSPVFRNEVGKGLTISSKAKHTTNASNAPVLIFTGIPFTNQRNTKTQSSYSTPSKLEENAEGKELQLKAR